MIQGVGPLLRLAMRRDRVIVPVCVAVLALIAYSSAVATIALYPTEHSRVTAVAAANSSPALVALYGTAHPTIGSLAGLKMFTSGAVFVALFALFVLRRHTRTDEETGRVELLTAGVMSRHAPLAAALAWTGAAVLATSALAAAGFAAAGLPVAGSVAFGLCWLVAGTSFAAITAVAMQVSQSARTCAAIAGGAVALSYVMRAVGDLGADEGWGRVLTWLSPLGWAQQVRPFAGERWWVGLVALGFTAAAVAAAFALRAHRDLGAGLVADRPGPAHTRMSSPLALAWRLQRGAIFGWALALFGGGVVMGGLASNAADLLESDQAQEMIRALGGEGSVSDAFIAAEFGIIAVVVAGFGIAATLRLLGEETSNRGELTLSTATSRLSWLMSHVTMALAGTAGVLLMLGLGAAVADGASHGDVGSGFARVLPAALVQIPAVWVIVAVAAALYGASARLALAAWGVLAACLLLGQFAELFHLPDVVQEASPFTHLPLLPGGSVDAAPLATLVAVAGAIVVVGATAFRRRDIG